MALIEISLARVFRYAGRDLADPQPDMAVTDVLKHYARQFPKLNGAKIIDPIVENDSYVYEFRDGGFGAKVDPLEVLKAWERGEMDRHLPSGTEPDCLDHQQRQRLWKLLSSPANPGTIDFQLPR